MNNARVKEEFNRESSENFYESFNCGNMAANLSGLLNSTLSLRIRRSICMYKYIAYSRVHVLFFF